MDPTLQTALISGLVVILSTLIAGAFTFFQQRREKFRWAEQLKQTYATEILRVRLEEYPKLTALFLPLGRYHWQDLKPAEIRKIALAVNEWAYGRGGLCAEPDTRSAIFILRETLDRFAEDKTAFQKVRDWRRLVINLLRRDLDLGPAYEIPEQEYQPLFNKFEKSLDELRKRG